MKRKTLVCRNCGHEVVIEIITSEEASERGVGIAQPKCPKCGSRNIELHD